MLILGPQIAVSADAVDAGPPPLRVRVARATFWITWSRGILQIITFATTLLIARILTPADYGVMALATLFTGTAAMVAEMGLGSAIIQFRDLDNREIDTCFWITMSLAIVAWLALATAAPLIAAWFGVPLLAAILPVASLALPFTACGVVSDSLLRKRLALDRVSQAEIMGSLVTLPVMIGCATIGLGVWTLVIGALVNPAVRSIVTFAFQPWYPSFRLGGERVREVVHFSISSLGIKIMWYLRENAGTFVLGKVAGQPAMVGLYSMANDLAHLPTSKISSVMNMLSTPVLAELQSDVDAMRLAFYRALRLTSAVVLPTCAGIALVADEMVAVLLGPKWSAAVPLVRLLSIYTALRAIDVLLPPVLFARRRERFLLWYCLALLVTVPGAAILGALWNGAVGMVAFYGPCYFVIMSFMARRALAELSGTISELFSQIWPILIAVAAMVPTIAIMREFGPLRQNTSEFVQLILLTATGGVAYVVALFAIGRPILKEAAEVVGWIICRQRG